MLRKCIILIILLKGFGIGKCLSQNLISNPSFSDVKMRKDTSKQHKLLLGNLSEVKNWYIPSYIKPFGNIIQINYYTSRDKQLNILNRNFTNIDQLFEENLGFIEIKINIVLANALIQQKLDIIQKGLYCFKFKYKQKLPWRRPLEFSFSQTNFKEFAPKGILRLPDSLIKISFNDSVTVHDDNLPWLQKAFILNLTGKEKYLSIGDLSHKTIIDPRNKKTKLTMCTYYIDDVELILIKDSSECECQTINKDLSKLYNRQFRTDEIIESDSLVMFNPINTNIINPMISPEAKNYLNNIIAFMQRNPTIKIKLIEYEPSNNNYTKPNNYFSFYNYIVFFGINKNRIFIEKGVCLDSTGRYCGLMSEMVKIGFKFYY
jgi:hypothetical protein